MLTGHGDMVTNIEPILSDKKEEGKKEEEKKEVEQKDKPIHIVENSHYPDSLKMVEGYNSFIKLFQVGEDDACQYYIEQEFTCQGFRDLYAYAC